MDEQSPHTVFDVAFCRIGTFRLAAAALRRYGEPMNGTLSGRVLIVDDVKDEAEFIQMLLERPGADRPRCAPRRSRRSSSSRSEDFDVVLTDLGMSEMSGLELCERILGTRPDLPVIVVTGQGSIEAAIGAMRAGAYDFLTKPVDPKLLGLERRARAPAPPAAARR